ncbi:MAG: hypothetical protein IJ600_00220, partial [Lachnospiraceae bacterium]|nr:hypothetical protein [Lachnospiraceae bacterium]
QFDQLRLIGGMTAKVDRFHKTTSNQEMCSVRLSRGRNVFLIDWPASLPLRGKNQRGGPHLLAVLSTPFFE